VGIQDRARNVEEEKRVEWHMPIVEGGEHQRGKGEKSIGQHRKRKKKEGELRMARKEKWPIEWKGVTSLKIFGGRTSWGGPSSLTNDMSSKKKRLLTQR